MVGERQSIVGGGALAGRAVRSVDGRTSFTSVMLAIAGAMALVLGMSGLYGVIAFAVSQRRREIGIRMALGAQAAEILGLFVWRGLALTGIGVAVGLVAAAGSTRLMRSLLFRRPTQSDHVRCGPDCACGGRGARQLSAGVPRSGG